MPSAYTNHVDEKTTLAELIESCAWAFLQGSREEDGVVWPLPLPRPFHAKPYLQEIEEAREYVAMLEGLSLSDVRVRFESCRISTDRHIEEVAAETKRLNAAFERLIVEVQGWDAPPALEELKAFAEQQCAQEIFSVRDDSPQAEVNLEEWHRGAIQDASYELIQAESRLAVARARRERENKFLAEVHAALRELRK